MRTSTDGHADETGPSGRAKPANPRTRLGAFGEELVAGWYERSGFVVVDRNWRTKCGELDLVAAKGPLLVFCEVKTRTSAGYGAAAEAVTPKKQRRIRLLAIGWLETHPEVRPNVIRFDVAAITGTDVSIVVSAF